MSVEKRKIVLGISGASGAIYAREIMKSLSKLDVIVGVVMSRNALENWEMEIGGFRKSDFPFDYYDSNDFQAPFASGSAKYDAMIVCPCSMGTLGRIASGISNDLMTRAADVMLKERRKLVLVPRETPLNLIHLRNMVTITEAGGIICPAIPSFYSGPQDISDLVKTVTNRVLDLVGLQADAFRWGNG